MRLGILKADSVRPELRAEHGDYPDMFAALFERADPAVSTVVYDVERGEYPAAVDDCAGYVITGSRHSVYDDLPWIPPLVDFAHELRRTGTRLAAICFGHQLVAHFGGGRVGPAPGGWAVGVHESEVLSLPVWMTPGASRFALLSSHKDQVLVLPPGAELIASNGFCPNAAFMLDGHTLAVQGHPEFSKPYARALLGVRRELLGEDTYRAAVDSLERATDEAAVGRWLINFFRGAGAAG